MAVEAAQPPQVTAEDVAFAYDDPDGSVTAVRLRYEDELERPDVTGEFTREGTTWRLRFPRPDVDRMEYELELTRATGATEVVCDPANPLRAPGPFGEKSVVEFPEYRRPAWLERDAPEGETVELEILSRTLRAHVHAAVWTSAGGRAGARLPLVVAHDGPDYAGYASLTLLLSAAVADGTLPPLRAALLAPVDRDRNYAASGAYAPALKYDVLPALAQVAPTPERGRARVAIGSSLGALAAFHAHRTYPELFGGLLLQSGSFFRPGAGDGLPGFPFQTRVERFVGSVHRAGAFPHPIPVTITCGEHEKNLANNRALHESLARQGYDVRLIENRDLHNWTAWRDTLDPHLVDLLRRAWT